MKDLTPIAENDFVLLEKERLGIGHSKTEEHVGLYSEKRMAEKEVRYELCRPVANDILEEARTALAVRFRFLDAALWRMPLKPSFDMFGIASDGVNMYYDPVYVVDRFKLSPNEVIRDVAHCLFHCIFRHPFMLYSVLRQPWDVACDIAIEGMLLDLMGEAFPCNFDRRAKQSLRVLSAQVGGVLTAERLYHLFSNEGNKVDLKSLAPIFYHDTHGLWYGAEDAEAQRGSSAAARQESRENQGGAMPNYEGSASIDEMRDPSELPSNLGGQGDEAAPSEDDGSTEGNEGAADAAQDNTPSQEELANQWEDLSQKMQVELETAIARMGDEAGNLVAALQAVNREKYDYADFLARFAVLHERMSVNPDEFDYIYYTFGLERYGNMPLIEPLEYKEDRGVRDFVIAIDTSESVSGPLVQAFMRKTYNILKQVENFHNRVNVHIVQCDARIQEDTKITSLDQLEMYMETMELRGFGGTDFRPVFDYVNLLVEKGEFTDLKGIVYFTDGQGTFPRKQPKYDSLFVFLDDGYTNPVVPPWALKVILNEKDL